MDGGDNVPWFLLRISVEVSPGKKMGAMIDRETGRRSAWSFGGGCDLRFAMVRGEPWLMVADTNVGRPVTGWKHAWDETDIELYKTVNGNLEPFTDEDWEILRKGKDYEGS